MSIYEKLANDQAYLKAITNELPNEAKTYNEEAFLTRFEENLQFAASLNNTVAPAIVPAGH